MLVFMYQLSLYVLYMQAPKNTIQMNVTNSAIPIKVCSSACARIIPIITAKTSVTLV